MVSHSVEETKSWARGDRVAMSGARGTVSYVPDDPRGWISVHWDGVAPWLGARVLAGWLKAAP